jgi:predicted aconitase with swiveling domain
VGSSVGSYSIYALKVNCVAPAAIICSGKTDLITASGCAISEIALVDMLEKSWPSVIRNGVELEVDADNRMVNLPKQTI